MDRHPTEIKCLICGTHRVVFGLATSETGVCPRCNFSGWDYADELDGFTRRMVVSGAYTGAVVDRRKAPRRQPQAVPGSDAEAKPAAAVEGARWKPPRAAAQ